MYKKKPLLHLRPPAGKSCSLRVLALVKWNARSMTRVDCDDLISITRLAALLAFSTLVFGSL